MLVSWVTMYTNCHRMKTRFSIMILLLFIINVNMKISEMMLKFTYKGGA